jgi:hypothetical protein
LNPSLGAEVAGVLEMAFAKQPAGRYTTCTEFISALAMAASVTPDWQPLRRGGVEDIKTVAGVPPAQPAAVAGPAAEPTMAAPAGLEEQPLAGISTAPALGSGARRRRKLEGIENKRSSVLRNVLLLVSVIAVVALGIVGVREFSGQLETAGTEVPIAQTQPGPGLVQPPPSIPEPEPVLTAPPPSEPPPPSQDPAPLTVYPPLTEPSPTAAAGSTVAEPSEPAPPKPAVIKPRQSTPPPKEHWVQIRTNPPAAEVSADDDPELNCRTPCELPLSRGRHVLIVSMAGHRLAPRIINVPEDLDVTVNLDRRAGTLAVSSNPPGATITLNGELRPEKTPSMIRLPEGTYKIVLALEGRQQFADTVEVKDQVITSIGVDW